MSRAARRRRRHQINAVFTHADDPDERIFFVGRASRVGHSVYAPDDVNDPHWVQRIAALEPDFASRSTIRLLAPAILAAASRGAYNLHGSLPRYRGRAPLNWVLVNGERDRRDAHAMTARADAGMIVAQQRVPIDYGDTAPSLHDKLCDAASALLERELPRLLDGTATHTPQDEAQATYVGRRTPADGELHWSRNAGELYNLVRAVTQPYPGAFTHSGDRKVIVWKATACSREGTAVPGTVLALDTLTIACGEGRSRSTAAGPKTGSASRACSLPPSWRSCRASASGISRSGDRHSDARRACSSSA
jgi:UDP-4-amino-4-deoxy-L-arabinose formyltransferase/UDP-glucuronic acid dehydrogenase (UDP-4-keto-hexauronic acid decarboxylating)